MNLIYGSQKFEYAPAPAKLMTPRAVNWRHQLPGVSYSHLPSLQRSTLQPRVVNWRYQLS